MPVGVPILENSMMLKPFKSAARFESLETILAPILNTPRSQVQESLDNYHLPNKKPPVCSMGLKVFGCKPLVTRRFLPLPGGLIQMTVAMPLIAKYFNANQIKATLLENFDKVKL